MNFSKDIKTLYKNLVINFTDLRRAELKAVESFLTWSLETQSTVQMVDAKDSLNCEVDVKRSPA